MGIAMLGHPPTRMGSPCGPLKQEGVRHELIPKLYRRSRRSALIITVSMANLRPLLITPRHDLDLQ